jgi:hypothetical protein
MDWRHEDFYESSVHGFVNPAQAGAVRRRVGGVHLADRFSERSDACSAWSEKKVVLSVSDVPVILRAAVPLNTVQKTAPFENAQLPTDQSDSAVFGKQIRCRTDTDHGT